MTVNTVAATTTLAIFSLLALCVCGTVHQHFFRPIRLRPLFVTSWSSSGAVAGTVGCFVGGFLATPAYTTAPTAADAYAAFTLYSNRSFRRPRYSLSFAATADDSSSASPSSSAAAAPTPQPPPPVRRTTHVVDGISCVELNISLPPPVRSVTVLEATAESQETLVDMALLLEDEELEEPGGIGAKLSKGDPYGAVLWPAASAVASHILRVPKNAAGESAPPSSPRSLPLQGLTVLELGAGTGLVSLACIQAGASSVVATDYEEIPLKLLRYAADRLNDEDGDDSDAIAPPSSALTTQILDMCDASVPLPPADIVVASDVLYDLCTARCVARRVVEALERGSRVVVGCSPGRPGRPAFLEELREGLRNSPSFRLSSSPEDIDFDEAVGWTCPNTRHELICGKGSTSVSDVPEPLAVKLLDLALPSLLPKKDT